MKAKAKDYDSSHLGPAELVKVENIDESLIEMWNDRSSDTSAQNTFEQNETTDRVSYSEIQPSTQKKMGIKNAFDFLTKSQGKKDNSSKKGVKNIK